MSPALVYKRKQQTHTRRSYVHVNVCLQEETVSSAMLTSSCPVLLRYRWIMRTSIVQDSMEPVSSHQ